MTCPRPFSDWRNWNLNLGCLALNRLGRMFVMQVTRSLEAGQLVPQLSSVSKESFSSFHSAIFSVKTSWSPLPLRVPRWSPLFQDVYPAIPCRHKRKWGRGGYLLPCDSSRVFPRSTQQTYSGPVRHMAQSCDQCSHCKESWEKETIGHFLLFDGRRAPSSKGGSRDGY